MTNVEQPNILFILVDDLGKEWISCYGAEDISTPHIDALAKGGTKFDHVYSMPQCTPTRLTFLTGQYPFRHGWVNHWDVPRWGGGAHYDENKNPCLIKGFKKVGYKTCITGKWQIDDFRVEPDALTKIGFDAYCMWTGYETGIEASAERYQNPYLFSDGLSKTHSEQFGPDIFRDYIIRFIRENKEHPMFIYFPMVLTHTPFVDTPDEQATDKLGKHKAMVRYTDKIVGQLTEALRQENILDNTLIVFSTDNGTTGQISGTMHGRLVQGKKGSHAEPGICAPFIVHWPAVVHANRTSAALIDFTDLMPTFLDLAGAPVAGEIFLDDGRRAVIDGRSFKSVLEENQNTSSRQWILSMGGGNNAKLSKNGVENQYAFRDRVLRNTQYKMVIGSDRIPQQFFDLYADPHEQENLIADLDTLDRRENFEFLASQVALFPKQDSDPRYLANPPQPWDVDITTESQVWKK